MNDQDEMFEAATETPAFLGCPAHMPKKLPSGFDGVEAAKPISEENKKKLEKSYLLMRGRLEKIADIALAADAKCGVSGRIGSNWMTCSKAICEIRLICGPDLVDKIAGRDKPLDPTAPEMKDSKQAAFNRRTWSFCDGLFPIIHVDTQEGFMALCKINGRTFKESVTKEDGADGPVWTGYIYDKGVCVCMIGSMGKGKTATKLMTHAAFMAYVKQLSGGGKKYHNRKGFLRQNAARAAKQEGK